MLERVEIVLAKGRGGGVAAIAKGTFEGVGYAAAHNGAAVTVFQAAGVSAPVVFPGVVVSAVGTLNGCFIATGVRVVKVEAFAALSESEGGGHVLHTTGARE